MRRQGLRDPAFGRHPRRRSARFRLTALYCGLFFPSAVALVLLTYALIVLVDRPKVPNVLIHKSALKSNLGGAAASHRGGTTGSATVHIEAVGHSLALSTGEFIVGSCIVVLAMIGVSILLGWLAAGRVLRPLRVMTMATRQISERNLHERLALHGPDDELKNLGDTIDGLLARLDSAFDSQRRFVANASHELRTPLMLSQTLLQVALANPNISLDSLRAACRDAIDAGKDQAQLIDALLTLARSQRGLGYREPVDLTAVVRDALAAHKPSAAARGIRLDATVDHAEISGDARLIHRLVSNLVDNAIRYNIVGGQVEILLATRVTEATLTVTNTGPPVRPDQVSRLLEPFQRSAPDRAASPDGLGLGLSIVADITKAHGASLDVRARPEGGLTVTTSFPAPSGSPGPYSARLSADRLLDNQRARHALVDVELSDQP
jgi:signal transduction histidine kinase